MARVKKAVHALKYRRTLLKKTKGYRFGRSTKERAASEAFAHAGKYSFTHRRDKKNDFRDLWIVRINAALSSTTLGTSGQALSYSKFMGALKKKGIAVNRKMLSEIGAEHPETFKRIVALAK